MEWQVKMRKKEFVEHMYAVVLGGAAEETEI